MRCESVRERFSPWLDGELAPVELEAVREHLESCPDCRADLTVWEEISASLRGINQCYTAPAGFSASVIGQLQNPGKQRWFAASAVRKWAASAAAVLILVAGSAGLTYQYWGGGAGPEVVDNSPAPAVVADNPYTPDITSPSAAGTENTDSSSSGSGVTNPTPETTIEASNPNTDAATQPPISEPVAVAENIIQPKIFLSKERVITTTLLKLRVNEAGTAYTQANSVSRVYATNSQILAQQAGTRYVMKYVVPVDNVDTFLSELSKLGTTIDQINSTQNVTSNFADTLEEYRAVVAQLNASQDEKQRDELAGRAAYLENLLSNWDSEAEKQVVVLCIEL